MRRAAGAVAAGLALAALAGCGNWVGEPPPPAGLTGVAVDASGSPSIVSYVCREGVRTVTVVGDREGLAEGEGNELVGTYRSDTDLRGLSTLDLGAPGDGWSPRTPTALAPDEGYLVGAHGAEGSAEVTVEVWIRAGRLAGLEPGGVYVSLPDGTGSGGLTRLSPDALEREARRLCDRDG